MTSFPLESQSSIKLFAVLLVHQCEVDERINVLNSQLVLNPWALMPLQNHRLKVLKELTLNKFAYVSIQRHGFQHVDLAKLSVSDLRQVCYPGWDPIYSDARLCIML